MLLSILVPTLGRAGWLPEVLSNIRRSTLTQHEVIFVAESDDRATCKALAGMPARWVVNGRSRGYGGAINTGYQRATGDYIFIGADDLSFHGGWDVVALPQMRDPVRVVGTNDLRSDVPQGASAPHCLVDRRYIEQVGGVPGAPPGVVLSEGQAYDFTSTGFIAVAKARGVFERCATSVVEHRSRSADKAACDAAHAKSSAGDWRDRAAFHARQHLWTP
jgi:glycosyltransferase involved in cell wall biosynthesis